jgi:hypothetical protein
MKKYIIFISLFLCFFSFSQEQKKDSLFIYYDNDLIKKYKHSIDNYNYYIIKHTGNNGNISFVEEKIYFDLKSKKIFCLKDIIKLAKAYYKKNTFKNDKINDYKLATHLGKFTLFFVNDNKFIKVQTWIEEK